MKDEWRVPTFVLIRIAALSKHQTSEQTRTMLRAAQNKTALKDRFRGFLVEGVKWE